MSQKMGAGARYKIIAGLNAPPKPLRRAALHALQLVFELVIALRSVLGAPAFHAAAVYPVRRAENLRSPWYPCLRRATSAPSWGRVEMSCGGGRPQVAEWAGNSVEVLLRVYAKCIHGRDEIDRKLIEDDLRDDESGREGR